MREGTRTVLSMQNNYQGPPEAFAMVVPVPAVCRRSNVKTLPNEVFSRRRSARRAAPRRVLGAGSLLRQTSEHDCTRRATVRLGARRRAPAAPAAASTTVQDRGAVRRRRVRHRRASAQD